MTAVPPSERLLVAQTGFLGDVVLTTPLLRALRRTLRPASLSVLTTPQAQPLVRDHPAVDRVLTDDKRGAGRGLSGLLHTARRLRAEAFTLAVAPHKSFRTGLLLALAGIPKRVGFRGSPGRSFYHQTVRRDADRHEIERILCLMRAFGCEPEDCDRTPHVAYAAAAGTEAQRLLDRAQVRASEPMFVVCPGSVWHTKRWSPAGYADVVRTLARDYGRVVLCGSEDEVGVAKEVEDRAQTPGVVNLTGRAGLQTFMALIDRARLVVCNDSAPMHLAVARRVPVVAIFCATTPALGYGPYTDAAVVVEREGLFCRPCGRHGGPRCPRGTEDCINQVTAHDVLAGIDRLLNTTTPSILRTAAASDAPLDPLVTSH